jgi:toxin ParE1/3/4
MSPHELRLILSPKAQEDFTDILQYTLETWGEAQQLAYRAILDKALLTVLGNPRIGTERPEISSAHRVFPAGSHIIVYRVSDSAILVSRILHVRMDARHHL